MTVTQLPRFVAIDIETTGLGASAVPLEIALIDIDSEVAQLAVPYVSPAAMGAADPEALAVNRYYERRLFRDALSERDTYDRAHELAEWLTGATLVGANVAFDASVFARWLEWHEVGPSWHFRLYDVEVATMTAYGLSAIPSMRRCCELLDIDNTDPHTAYGDACAAAEAFRRLRGMTPIALPSEVA